MTEYLLLESALLAFRDALRVAGLQHLAQRVPVDPIRIPDDFHHVHERVRTLQTLLLLRPPPARVFDKIWTQQHRVDELIIKIDEALKAQ